MAHKLYVYLSGGRGDAYVTEAWDGKAPNEEGMVDAEGVAEDGTMGKEVGAPYRDIFSGVTPFYVKDLSVMGGALQSPDPVVPPQGSGLIIKEGTEEAEGVNTSLFLRVTGTPKVTHSDEVAHKRPRQHFQVYTWLIFKESDAGPFYKFRKSQVIGWGKNPRS